MATNAQKIPYARSLNDFAAARTRNATQRLGKAIPCTVTHVAGSIVTVKFEVQAGVFTLPPVTMPVMGPEYIRYPIQVGCKGLAVASDFYLGAMSGLGSGVATLNPQPNLSGLVFIPIGNTGFTMTPDPNKLVLYGPDGTIIKAATGTPEINVTTTSITLSVGAHSIVIDATGVTIDGKVFLTHEHSGVATGAFNTGPVV